MTRRALPPPLPPQVTAIQRERVMVSQFLAVGVGLALGLYMHRQGWTLASNILGVFTFAVPLSFLLFLNIPDARARIALFGAILFAVAARLYWMPISRFVASCCAIVALLTFIAFVANERRVAKGLVLLLALVLTAFQANRLFGPWVQLG